MNHQVNLPVAESPTAGAIERVRDKARDLGARIVEVLDTCANAWAAAGLYEELSRLSDPELERRGIRRADLQRHVFDGLANPTSRL